MDMLLDRRAVLRAGALFGGALLAGAASACTAPGRRTTPSASSPTTAVAPGPTTTTGARGSTVLLAYFSRAGENYYYGGRTTLSVGNTRVIAETIQRLAAVDVYAIEAADPYPDDYEQTVERNVREEQDNARPAIANPLPDLSGYDTVLLGCPIWNVQAPMIMRTFVDGVDLAGKTIHPFVTYAVSGMGRVADDYATMCPNSTVNDGLAVRGEEAGTAEGAVGNWLRAIGLTNP